MSDVGWLVGPSHIFGFPFCQRLWTVTERPQRLVTFETFDQSDEAKCASGVWRPKCFLKLRMNVYMKAKMIRNLCEGKNASQKCV